MSESQIRDVLLKYSNAGNTDKASYHSYEFFYPQELQYLRSKPENELHILEIGTAKGGSLRCWMELYPTAKFYGIDYNIQNIEDDVRNDSRLSLVNMSQSDPAVSSLFKGTEFDLIIEDASHIASDQIATFHMLKSRVAKGGKYIIEDIYPEHIYPEYFMKNFRVVDISHIKNRGDDRCFIYENN
jgi:cephalosporin hydroxylase